MRLIIAEKPAMARGIADALGQARPGHGAIVCGSTTVTWCAGHLLQTLRPEEYVSGAFVRVEELPVVPSVWKLKARDARARQQLGVIKALLESASEVVHAGDADREGQLLVDEVLIAAGWKGKTLRLWTGSLDEDTLRRALADLKPNESLRGLYESALARQRADWLLGFNASMALSRSLKAQGLAGGWSVGRVQTPTLALIVERAAQIKAHTRQDHYKVQIALEDGVTAQWQIPEDYLTDGLLLERAPADHTAREVEGQAGLVVSYSARKGQRAAPLPFSLAELQMRANDKFGLSAGQTLEAAQALYEAKAATYPRTDCRYLPEDMRGDAPRVLAALGADGTNDVDAGRRHAAWNDRQVTAHHAIIPTGQKVPGSAGDNAQKVYQLIRESYIRLFMPDEEFERQQAIFEFHGSPNLHFKATARKTLNPGWTALGKADADDDQDAQNPTLPAYRDGQAAPCDSAAVNALQTKPPKPYTDKTLIAAMIGIHKLVTDPRLKALLKETSGLGTEATRAAMIETLIERDYIVRQGKELLPTERGTTLIGILRESYPSLADPGETAVQEDALADIAAQKLAFDQFMTAVAGKTAAATKALLTRVAVNVRKEVCPACAEPACVPRQSKAGHPYWKCRACAAAFGDAGGQPGQAFAQRAEGEVRPPPEAGPPCPKCQRETGNYLTQNAKPYFRCATCAQAWWPDFHDPQKTGRARQAM